MDNQETNCDGMNPAMVEHLRIRDPDTGEILFNNRVVTQSILKDDIDASDR